MTAPSATSAHLVPGESAEDFVPHLQPATPSFAAQAMRYGETPPAGRLLPDHSAPGSRPVAAAGQGAVYNNIADTDAARECVKNFRGPACVIVKHANPCGVAWPFIDRRSRPMLAFATDPESAFGGIIAFNRELDGATARAIVERQFVEVIIAPGASAEALKAVGAKQNAPFAGMRRMVRPAPRLSGLQARQRRPAGAGPRPGMVADRKWWSNATSELQDLLFAWKVAKFVKSNAIVYAANGQTIGVAPAR